MAVEFLIDIEGELNKVLKKIPGRSYSSFNTDFINELMIESSNGIFGNIPKAMLNQELTIAFRDYESTFKDRIKKRIERDNNVNWDEIKSEKVYPSIEGKRVPTFEQQINKTWQVSKGNFRDTVIKNRTRYQSALKHLKNGRLDYLDKMGISGKNDKEILENIASDITNKLAKGLGFNMNNREEALRQTSETRIRYLEDKRKLKGKVFYNLGERERHCAVCIEYAEIKEYKSMALAPELPVHTRCGCYYTSAE